MPLIDQPVLSGLRVRYRRLLVRAGMRTVERQMGALLGVTRQWL